MEKKKTNQKLKLLKKNTENFNFPDYFEHPDKYLFTFGLFFFGNTQIVIYRL